MASAEGGKSGSCASDENSFFLALKGKSENERVEELKKLVKQFGNLTEEHREQKAEMEERQRAEMSALMSRHEQEQKMLKGYMGVLKQDVRAIKALEAATGEVSGLLHHPSCYTQGRWECCLSEERLNTGCHAGVPKHHPGIVETRSGRIDDFCDTHDSTEVSFEAWSCCGSYGSQPGRGWGGCQIGIHPSQIKVAEESI